MTMLTILFFWFCLVDMAAYFVTKFPERTSRWYYKLPGGGIAAWLKFGTPASPY